VSESAPDAGRGAVPPSESTGTLGAASEAPPTEAAPTEGPFAPGASEGQRRYTAEEAGRVSGGVYGTIVAAAVVAAIGPKDVDDVYIIAAMVVTSLVFYAAHVFSAILAASMQLGHSLAPRERRAIAAREWPMLTAVVPLAVPLALGAVGVIDSAFAAWVAMGVAVVVLGAWGLRIGMLEERGPWRSFVLSMCTASFGLFLVVMKAVVSH